MIFIIIAELILLLFLLYYIVVIKQIVFLEGFEDIRPTVLIDAINPNICKSLNNAVASDPQLQSDINSSVKSLVQGNYKIPLNKKIDMDLNKYEYCYIKDFNYTKQDGGPICSLNPDDFSDPIDRAVYNDIGLNTINNVFLLDVYENDKVAPVSKCIMEINPQNVNYTDAASLNNAIKAYNSKFLYKELDKSKEVAQSALLLTSKTAQQLHEKNIELDKVSKTNQDLEQNNTVLSQTNIRLSAKNEAETNHSIYVIDSNFSSYTEIIETRNVSKLTPIYIKIRSDPKYSKYSDAGLIVIPNGYSVTVNFWTGNSIYKATQYIEKELLTSSIDSLIVYKT